VARALAVTLFAAGRARPRTCRVAGARRLPRALVFIAGRGRSFSPPPGGDGHPGPALPPRGTAAHGRDLPRLPTSRPVHSLAPARPGQGEKGVNMSASCGGTPRRIAVIASLTTGAFLLPSTIAHADPTADEVREEIEALEEEYMELN